MHKAADEGFVGGSKFRCAKARLSTVEDAQSPVGFEDQLQYVVCPREIMTDGAAQKLE